MYDTNIRAKTGRFSRQNRRNLNLHCVLVGCFGVGSPPLPRFSVSLTCNTTTMSNGHCIQLRPEWFSLSSFSSLPSRQHRVVVIFLFYWIFGTESSTKRGTYQSFTDSALLKRVSSKIIFPECSLKIIRINFQKSKISFEKFYRQIIL